MNTILSDIKARHSVNLGKRTVIGIQLYVIVWAVMIFSTGFYRTNPVLSFSILTLLLIISALRSFHFYHYDALIITEPVKNYILLFIGIFVSVLLWTSLFIYFIFNSDNVQIKTLMIITVAGFASGGCISYSLDRRVSLTYISTLLLPPIFLIFLMKRDEIPLALILLTYFCYLFYLTLKANQDYRVALNNEMELEKQSLTDVLTGLYNRRYFNKILEVEWNRAIRNNVPLSLVLFDIDDFKEVNDTHGHPAGDAYLSFTAGMLKSVFKRDIDSVIRYGGEEFIVLLSNTDINIAVHLAEKTRVGFTNEGLLFEGNNLKTTVSAGVKSMIPGRGDAREVFISDVDKALYLAKKKGKNQVQVY